MGMAFIGRERGGIRIQIEARKMQNEFSVVVSSFHSYALLSSQNVGCNILGAGTCPDYFVVALYFDDFT